MTQTILIVEDNDLNQKLFADVLQVYGYAVLQAWDGSQGPHCLA
jgi:CheY-like chemotaxis protein